MNTNLGENLTQSCVLVFGREILCILGLAGAKFKQNLTNPRYTCHTCIASTIKVMLSVRLDEETERQLADILAHEQTEKSELIRARDSVSPTGASLL